ncbi:gamma-glutamyltransferase [Diplodia corticola]|uniref:Gamma-glutamyltransferase n=1 Tax=Diplodia corticola TaxID=236234 RepID=A0A1J9S3U6_9PEZI|nr:gamma-glutamyltransferase [Diplodia corticola]OJD35215.1 gamma-glutamyltransferase [Diplodia corticola]
MLSHTRPTLLSALLLPAAALTLAAPTTSTLSTSKTIKLTANVLSSDLTPSIQSYELNPFALSSTDASCANALGLSPASHGALFHSDSETPSVFTLQTGTGYAQRLSAVVTPGGTATVPAARAVGVDCGTSGTEGVGIVQKDDGSGTPVLRYGKEGSGWMACPAGTLNAEVPADEGAVVVGYRDAGQRVLSGCAEVEFVAVCSDETDGGEASAVEVPCVVVV